MGKYFRASNVKKSVVDERTTQGRNGGRARGAQLSGRRITTGARNHCGWANHCGGRRKVPPMSQVHASIQYICYRKNSSSNVGAQNLPRCFRSVTRLD